MSAEHPILRSDPGLNVVNEPEPDQRIASDRQAIESMRTGPNRFAALLVRLGLEASDLGDMDRRLASSLGLGITAMFHTRTGDMPESAPTLLRNGSLGSIARVDVLGGMVRLSLANILESVNPIAIDFGKYNGQYYPLTVYERRTDGSLATKNYTGEPLAYPRGWGRREVSQLILASRDFGYFAEDTEAALSAGSVEPVVFVGNANFGREISE